METVIYKNKKYTIVEATDISKWPNIAKNHPEARLSFIAEGKNGGLISGFICSNGIKTIFE